MGSNVTSDANILFTLLTVASIGSMYLAGRIAERRGRRFTRWAWTVSYTHLTLPTILRV